MYPTLVGPYLLCCLFLVLSGVGSAGGICLLGGVGGTGDGGKDPSSCGGAGGDVDGGNGGDINIADLRCGDM